MYTTESLNHLRTLTWLDKERRLLTAGSTAAALVEQQQAVTRGRMSPSLVSFHDRYAMRGQPSVVPLSGSSCSACHLKLPSGVLSELAAPGRYTMCPNCSVVVWSGENPIVVLPTPTTKKAGRKKTYA
jgi:predicted  nucleic acid-binding Zn-ribbon protein